MTVLPGPGYYRDEVVPVVIPLGELEIVAVGKIRGKTR
jgi:hypothetical protein